jgi:hypothetical protein
VLAFAGAPCVALAFGGFMAATTRWEEWTEYSTWNARYLQDFQSCARTRRSLCHKSGRVGVQGAGEFRNCLIALKSVDACLA